MTTAIPTPSPAPEPGPRTTDTARSAAVDRSLTALRDALESVQDSLDQLEAELAAAGEPTDVSTGTP